MHAIRNSLLGLGVIAAAVSFTPVNAGAADYLTGYVGDYSLRGEQSAQFGVEYRFSSPWSGALLSGLRPTLGANVNSDGDFYGYGGFNWDLPLGKTPFVFTPNFMVGGWHHDEGKDLGGPIEFRSGLELSYEMPNTQRVGVAFNHISNASIYDRNPGAETILINYSIPVGAIFGR
jgi:hypothetical protein